MGKNISSRKFFVRLWLLSQLGPIWSICEATGNDLFLRPHIFHAHVLYHKVLISLQSSALGLAISRTKYWAEGIFTKNKLTGRWLTRPLPVKVWTKHVGKNQLFNFGWCLFLFFKLWFRDSEDNCNVKDLIRNFHVGFWDQSDFGLAKVRLYIIWKWSWKLRIMERLWKRIYCIPNNPSLAG